MHHGGTHLARDVCQAVVDDRQGDGVDRSEAVARVGPHGRRSFGQRHAEDAVRQHRQGVAGRDQRRRVQFLDDRRARQRAAGRQRVTPVDGTGGVGAGADPYRVALARLRRRTGGQLGQGGCGGGADRGDVEVDDFHHLAGEVVAVEAAVRLAEVVEQGLEGIVGDRSGGDGYVLLVVLAGVAHADRALHDRLARASLLMRLRHRFALQARQGGVDLGGVRKVRSMEACRAPVRADVGGQRPERGGESRVRRHDHLSHPERRGHRRAVQGAGATEGDQREAARVDAAFHGQDADGVRHLFVDKIDDRRSGLFRAHVQCAAQLFHRATGGRGIEPHLAAQERAGIDPAEHQVGVGDGHLLAALAIADRARRRAGALRPHAQHAARIDPGDRAAAGADGAQVDAGRRNRQAELDLVAGRVGDLPAGHQGHVGAGAAHVEGDQVAAAGLLAEVAPADHAAGQSGQHGVGRQLPGRGRGHLSAVGLHDGEGAAEAALAQALLQLLDPGRHARSEIGVQDGGAAALVLAPHRRDGAGGRDRQVGKAAAEELGQAPLVLGVHVGKQQVHRQCRAAPGRPAMLGEPLRDQAGDALQLVAGQFREHLAAGRHPLAHADAVAARHERHRLLPLQVVRVLLVDPLDERHVLEAVRGEVEDAGAAPLQHGVDTERGAKHQQRQLLGRNAGARERVEHGAAGPGRRRGHLGDVQQATAVRSDRDQVGEGAAGIDAHPIRHGPRSSCPYVRSGGGFPAFW